MRLGTDVLDQLAAAVRDAEGLVFDLAGRAGNVPIVGSGVGAFAGQLFGNLLDAALTGQLAYCPHLGNPLVTFAAAWRPGELWCAECALTKMALSGPEDLTCDRCRKVVPTIRGCNVQGGPVVMSFGLCQPCYAIETAAQIRSGTRARRRR